MIEIDDIAKTIELRKSVRTYNGLKLDHVLNRQIVKAIGCATPLFDNDVRQPQIFLTDADQNGRLGTYGVIEGAREYLTGYCADNCAAKMNLGFMLEQVVLKAAELGLGTCWMGGTFRKNAFGEPEGLAKGNELRIVSPVGHPTPKKRMFERLSRKIAKSDGRKPFEELFTIDPQTEEATKVRECLEAVRLAPSSTNSQPWRARATGGVVEFWSASEGRFTPYDMGIAYCHFLLMARAVGLEGKFQINPSKPLPALNFLR